MQTATLIPIITAIVSIVAILISAYVSRLTINAARQTLEKQQLGSMTAKLYDVRIESYPKGMEITEALRKIQLAGDVTLSVDYLNNIVSQLDLWYSSKAGFVLSRNSAQCFSALHKRYPRKATIEWHLFARTNRQNGEIQTGVSHCAPGRYIAAF